MEKYGWTLTEVKQQPYIELLDLLNSEDEVEEKQGESEQKVYTGSDLKFLFGS